MNQELDIERLQELAGMNDDESQRLDESFDYDLMDALVDQLGFEQTLINVLQNLGRAEANRVLQDLERHFLR